MKPYVRDAHANKQINTISTYVEDGLSDSEITSRLSNIGYKNLAKSDGAWTAKDIEDIRRKFNLNIAEGFIEAKPIGKVNKKLAQEVSVVDIQMPFMSMVLFMVTWAIASIPAMFILFLFCVFAYTVIFVGLLNH